MYHQDLLEEAKHPQNMGTLENPDLQTTEFNASCGDVVSVEIKLSDDKSEILSVRWKGDGCIISQASMSVLSAQLEGMKVSEVEKIKQEDLLELLGLDSITPGRIKCLHLGLHAVKKVLK